MIDSIASLPRPRTSKDCSRNAHAPSSSGTGGRTLMDSSDPVFRRLPLRCSAAFRARSSAASRRNRVDRPIFGNWIPVQPPAKRLATSPSQLTLFSSWVINPPSRSNSSAARWNSAASRSSSSASAPYITLMTDSLVPAAGRGTRPGSLPLRAPGPRSSTLPRGGRSTQRGISRGPGPPSSPAPPVNRACASSLRCSLCDVEARWRTRTVRAHHLQPVPCRILSVASVRSAGQVTERRRQSSCRRPDTVSSGGRLLLLVGVGRGPGGCGLQALGNLIERSAVLAGPVAVELFAVGADPGGAVQLPGQLLTQRIDLACLRIQLCSQVANRLDVHSGEVAHVISLSYCGECDDVGHHKER